MARVAGRLRCLVGVFKSLDNELFEISPVAVVGGWFAADGGVTKAVAPAANAGTFAAACPRVESELGAVEVVAETVVALAAAPTTWAPRTVL